uniref:Uncharacterized protein n=1 Tax=Arundo donax TaxID=35708 RepID=A0A0A8ZPJ0_ARUDO
MFSILHLHYAPAISSQY